MTAQPSDYAFATLRTPLNEAAHRGHGDIVNLLLQHEADPTKGVTSTAINIVVCMLVNHAHLWLFVGNVHAESKLHIATRLHFAVLWMMQR